jgi:hypothetical protein
MPDLADLRALRAYDLRDILTNLPYHYHVQWNDVGGLSVWDRHPEEADARLVG